MRQMLRLLASEVRHNFRHMHNASFIRQRALRHASTQAKQPLKASVVSLRGVAAGVLVIASVYGVGGYFALKDTSVASIYEQYVPLGKNILDVLEDRQHRRRMRAREEYYEQKNATVTPYISKRSAVTSALSTTNTAAKRESLTSADLYSGDRGEAIAQFYDNAFNSALGSGAGASESEDPLSPELFFSAQSGTVGYEEKAYLPLVVLPDIRDPAIRDVAMRLNDLISSVNVSAVSDESVYGIARALKALGKDIKQKGGPDADIFRAKSKRFETLISAHNEIIKQAHDTDNPSEVKNEDTVELKGMLGAITQDYHKRLAREILQVERILVSHVNSRGRLGSGENSIEPSSLPPPIPASKPSSLMAKELAPQQNDLSLSPENRNLVLDLQVSFTFLIAELQKKRTTETVAPYIEGIQSTIEKSPIPKDELIKLALQGVFVPRDVDLTPIIDKILKQ